MVIDDPSTEEDALTTVFSRYRGEPGELIPILQDIQNAAGWLSKESLADTARFLNIPESTVYGVATFYAQFHLTRQGKHKIRVCQGTACHVRGAQRIMQAIGEKLGVEPGETTEDFSFSLERVACFGSCALAPVMVADDTVYGNVTPGKAKEIIEGLE